MIWHEKDIDFSKIDWKLFEELCFDLLLKYHFHSLVWRQGGHDKGRDIEGYFTVTNPIIGNFQEKWFVECKHHKGGLKVTDISDKIEWALAENANHFLLMTNSHLTQATREWLEKKGENLRFRVHEMDGKSLKARLLAFPDLMIKYFFSDGGMVISEMLKLWVLYDILPDAKSFYSTMKNVDPGKLKMEHLIFLLYCRHSLNDELERYCEDQEQEELNDKLVLPAIVENIGSSKFVFTEAELKIMHILPHFLGRQSSIQQNSDKRTFFLREKYKGNFLLELYLGKHNQKLECQAALRRIKKTA
jgi:hypothetical protein